MEGRVCSCHVTLSSRSGSGNASQETQSRLANCSPRCYISVDMTGAGWLSVSAPLLKNNHKITMMTEAIKIEDISCFLCIVSSTTFGIPLERSLVDYRAILPQKVCH